MQNDPDQKIKVVIAEDHKGVRKLLQISLNQDDRFQVVGETDNGLEAVEIADKLRPDIFVMDIRLPGLNGIESTRKIISNCPSTKVIVMSMYDDNSFIYDSLSAGARGYLIKSRINELPEAITEVHSGKLYLSQPITLENIEIYRRKTNKPELKVLKPES